MISAKPAPERAQWLTDHEQQAWRAYLRGSRLLDQALDEDLQAHGVQLSEYEVLAMVSEGEPGGVRMSALAERVLQSRGRLSHTATRLERRGWVTRVPAAEDGRGVEISLTPQGWAALEELAVVHVDSVRERLLGHLTPEEFHELGRLMAVVRCGLLGLDPDDPAPIP